MTGDTPAPVPDEDGEPVIDVGYMSLPAEVQRAAEASLRPSGTDPREPLGRKVHEIRCAFGAALDRPMTPAPWEERHPRQRELDMQIGEAVAAAVLEHLTAVIPPERFRDMADWFDTDDEFKMSMFPETWPPGSRTRETQDDLRRFADLLKIGSEEEGRG